METEAPTGSGSLLTNSAALLAARVFAIACGGALSLYAIRTLSVTHYGEYSIAVSMAGLFGVLSEFGIATVAVRRMIEAPAERGITLGTALAAEIVTSLVAAAFMLPVALLLGYSAQIIALLGIGTALVLAQGTLAALEAPFQATRSLSYVAFFSALQWGVTAALGIGLLASGGGPKALMVALVAGNAVAAPAALYILRRRLRIRPAFGRLRSGVVSFLRVGAPIAWVGGMTVIYDRVDLLLVSRLDSTEAAAFYNVALTILALSQVLPAVLTTSFFPVLSDVLRVDVDAARVSLERVARMFLFVSVPAVVFLAISADTLVPAVFGERYDEAAGAAAIIGGSIVLGFLNYLLWYVLLAAHREGRKALIMTMALVVNVALNAVLIPRYGPSGAATALVASDVLVGGLQIRLVRREVLSMRWGTILLPPAVAAALAGGAGLALRGQTHIGAAALALVLCAGLLVLSGYVRRAEWHAIAGRIESPPQ